MHNIESRIADTSQTINLSLARFALFLVYFWFGFLKVLGYSPATPLVLDLLDRTLPFIEPDLFMVLFGLFEILIGILFLIPKATRIALLLLALHLVSTILPLFVLPHHVWTSFLVPTLEGQYIIKNILIISAGVTVATSLKK